MGKRFLIILLSLISTVALADTTQGYDVLGLARYCDQYLQAPKLPAVSTLMNTFGDPLPCIEKRIQQGGLSKVEIKLRDATCVRNNKCPAGSPSLTDWNEMTKRAQRVNALAVKYPNVEFWAAPYLEHDIKDNNTIIKACSVIAAACPTCKCLNVPTSGSARPPGIPVEVHTTTGRAFSVSSDGGSFFDADNVSSDGNGFEHRVAGSYMSYAWIPEFNLRCSGEKTFTMPDKRTEVPSADLFRQVYLIEQPETPSPPAPPVCKVVRRLDPKKLEIEKTNAEAYCNGQNKDIRGNKSLLMIQQPGRLGDKLNIMRSDGKVVGRYGFYSNYVPSPGIYRWYIGLGSNQTNSQLYDALGSEWGFVDLGKGNCLLINAVRRMGVYR